MNGEDHPPILLVDDEPTILRLMQVQLGDRYRLIPCTNAADGLAAIGKYDFGCIISDFQMPGMDGIEFLSHASQMSPNSVRVMLTGNAHFDAAVDAVNRAGVWRFLAKPCNSQSVGETIENALEEHRRITAEQKLLDETLGGVVGLLADVMAVIHPTAGDRAITGAALVRDICKELKVPNAWELRTASILAPLGCISLPRETVHRAYAGEDLSPNEQKRFEEHPLIGADLLTRIPRFENVARFVRSQFSETLAADSDDLGILRIVDHYLCYIDQGLPYREAIDRVRSSAGSEGMGSVVDALATVINRRAAVRFEFVPLGKLEVGSVIAEDIHDTSGRLRIRSGTELSMLQHELMQYAPAGLFDLDAPIATVAEPVQKESVEPRSSLTEIHQS